MALDEALAEAVRAGKSPTTLRFYGWDSPSVTIGRFQLVGELDLGFLREEDIPLVRRPTGGRAVLHEEELTYSFSARTREGLFSGGLLKSYHKLGEAFSLAFRTMGISALSAGTRRARGSRSPLCFQSASYGEITVERRKIIGSAQRRWPDGLLQQGSIPYVIDRRKLRGVFGNHAEDTGNAMAGIREIITDLEARKFKKAVRRAFEEVFQVEFRESGPTEREESRAEELLRGKYLSPEWNLRK